MTSINRQNKTPIAMEVAKGGGGGETEKVPRGGLMLDHNWDAVGTR